MCKLLPISPSPTRDQRNVQSWTTTLRPKVERSRSRQLPQHVELSSNEPDSPENCAEITKSPTGSSDQRTSPISSQGIRRGKWAGKSRNGETSLRRPVSRPCWEVILPDTVGESPVSAHPTKTLKHPPRQLSSLRQRRKNARTRRSRAIAGEFSMRRACVNSLQEGDSLLTSPVAAGGAHHGVPHDHHRSPVVG